MQLCAYDFKFFNADDGLLDFLKSLLGLSPLHGLFPCLLVT